MDSEGRLKTHHQVAIGNNPERSRIHNRRVVLDVLRVHGPLGRTRIARFTHLTPQAVANIVGELVSENLLIEMGRFRSGRGQPPIQFAVNPDGPVTIGFEIAADHLVTVLLDLAGRVRSQSIVPIYDAGPEQVIPRLVSELNATRSKADIKESAVLGVGIVMPGPFEIADMASVPPTVLPGWVGLDAAKLIGEATQQKISIENDATAAAVGERLFGVGRLLSNFCMLYFGAGIGLGIIHDGRPFRGAFGNAGEIGQILVRGARTSRHDHNGSLERRASLYALKEKLLAAGIEQAGYADLEALHATRHPILMEWIGDASNHLAPVVAMLENVLDPETIVFGGSLPDAIVDNLIAGLDPLPASVAGWRARALPRVVRGQTGQLTAALGAAALPLFETVTPKLGVSQLRLAGGGRVNRESHAGGL